MSEQSKLPAETDAEKPVQSAEPAFDAASQSLTNALRLSFRVLTVAILVLVVLFFSRGFFTVEPDQKVVIERFGKCDPSLVKDKGWHYALPYPIDREVPVWVRPKTMDINVFWPKVTQEAKEAAMTKGAQNQPEVFADADDGTVLTGDMNVMQGRLQIVYSIRGGAGATADDVIKYYQKVGDEANEQRLIRGLVQNAFIIALSGRTVSDVYPISADESPEKVQARLQLSERIQTLVQKTIQSLDAGLDVQRLTIMAIRPPTQVKPAFDAVLSAHTGAKTSIQEAERARNKMLIDATGEVGIELGKTIAERWEAYGKSDAAKVADADKKISALLADAKGEVASIMADARTYRTTVVSEASADSASITKLMADNSDAGAASLKVFLEEMRVEAMEEALKGAYEKYLFNPSRDGPTTLEIWLNRRTEIRRSETIIEQQR